MIKLTTTIILIGFLLAGGVSAQGMMGFGRNPGATVQSNENADISVALQDIYKDQKISTSSQINCGQVTDAQYEKLGDAYMGLVHPGQEHAYMEQMMGGEGSPILKQAHINMGRAYLGCWAGYNAAPLMMPMMGYYSTPYAVQNGSFPSMMSRWYGSAMMGGYGLGLYGFHWITMVLIWVLLLLAIVALMKWLLNKKN